MTTWRWPNVTTTVEGDLIVHRFRDGAERTFSLARFARTGEPDEFGVIHRLFPNLEASAAELRAVWNDPR